MKEDKSYKVILQGEIADGYDPDEVKEKLAIVFKKNRKEIDKLLKNPTPIRKNLTRDVALRYQNGLEKIGVVCTIESNEKLPVRPSTNPDDTLSLVQKDTTSSDVKKLALILDKDTLSVINVKMPFGSMVVFILKSILASIPAFIIVGAIFVGIFMGLQMAGLIPNLNIGLRP